MVRISRSWKALGKCRYLRNLCKDLHFKKEDTQRTGIGLLLHRCSNTRTGNHSQFLKSRRRIVKLLLTQNRRAALRNMLLMFLFYKLGGAFWFYPWTTTLQNCLRLPLVAKRLYIVVALDIFIKWRWMAVTIFSSHVPTTDATYWRAFMIAQV